MLGHHQLHIAYTSSAHELRTCLNSFHVFFDTYYLAMSPMQVVALMLCCIGSEVCICIIACLTIKHHLRAEHEVTHSSVAIDLVCVKPKQAK